MDYIIIAFFLTLIAILIEGFYQKSTNAVCTSKKRLDGKTAIVTGGTAGIGLEIALDFAERGARVIIACPFEDEGAEALKTIKEKSGCDDVFFKLLDLSSLKSVRQFATDIISSEKRIDILMNNAGVSVPSNTKTEDEINYVMQVNYYGHFLLTLLLLPVLKKTGTESEPSRIVTTSSIFHLSGEANPDKIDNPKNTALQSYASSKLCLMIFTHHLSKKLNPNVTVNCADPGPVGTKIFASAGPIVGTLITWGSSLFFKTPWQGAQTSLYVALDKEGSTTSGQMFKNCKLIRAKPDAYDNDIGEKLWQASVTNVKINDEELTECFK